MDSERDEVDRSGDGSKCWDLCYGKRLVLMGALDSGDGRLKKSRNHRTEKCVIMIPSIKMKQGAAVDERLTAPLTWMRTNGERIPTGSKWNTSSAV